jgi:D-amino-acid oxidase
LIPRPRGGGTIIGGSKEIGDFETRVRADTQQALLKKSVEVFPDFVSSVDQFKVVKDNVGRRPWREGGIRVEIEEVSPDQNIVHGYGAGARGYELSWGVAERVLRLVQDISDTTARL